MSDRLSVVSTKLSGVIWGRIHKIPALPSVIGYTNGLFLAYEGFGFEPGEDLTSWS